MKACISSSSSCLSHTLAYGDISQGRIIEAHTTTAWRWVKTAEKRAEELGAIAPGKQVSTHTLRHSYARHLLINGIPINYLVCCQRASDVSVWHLYHEPIALVLLLERGARSAWDGKGRYLDNIFVEHLWRSIKHEKTYLRAYRNGSEARRGIDAYLDLYNRDRPHQALIYRTPAQVFAAGRSIRYLPDQASTLSYRKVMSEFPAGVTLNVVSSLS